MRTKARRSAQRGITLIELMVVVAIVAILGTVAVANYRSQALRSNRAEGKSALLRVQAAQEKYYLSAHEYTDDLDDLKLPAQTERQLYRIELVVEDDGDAYTATATAIGSQVADEDCPVFSIDETGQRLPALGASRCWQ
ncbi:type IV pilin protein [Steroidobacter sp. S1-65]|uniref:Type IV pilin protein n=1 Tax=Steroidobacter gossypii TaxID=2805490 RepID=A0ABS1WW29_9GAMM|nr:type IV pilin protein [Steroidobacter gossypii]MBM0105158.1 type IV pilin protein [Steroidobacter gossypii]